MIEPHTFNSATQLIKYSVESIRLRLKRRFNEEMQPRLDEWWRKASAEAVADLQDAIEVQLLKKPNGELEVIFILQPIGFDKEDK